MLKFSDNLPKRLDLTPEATGGKCMWDVVFLEVLEIEEVAELEDKGEEAAGVKKAGVSALEGAEEAELSEL